MVALEPEEAKVFDLLDIRDREGWVGAFTFRQYPGAYPNGTRVKKVRGEPGDKHSLGAKATVLCSAVRMPWGSLGYFVEWDDLPQHAAFIVGDKLGVVGEHDSKLPYTIEEIEGRRSILCHVCGMRSFNQNDVDFKYCGKCHDFHKEPA